MRGSSGQPEQLVGGPTESAHWLPHAIALAIIVYWLVVKSILFLRLEYASDLFTNLELTRSFFEGRPLLWENAYGNHKLFHNFYIAVLFYPFTRFLSAYGLFVAAAFLYWWAVREILKRASTNHDRRDLYWAVLAAMALGPIAFWIWDDPIYGFHFELILVPISVLFALSLAECSKWAWVFAALIVVTREEGAIVAWCIHVLHEVLGSQPGAGRPGMRRAPLRRLAFITGFWLLMFISGMALLVAQGASHGRLGLALTGLRGTVADPVSRALLTESLIDAGVLLAAGGIVYLAGIPLRGLATSVVVSLTLVLPTAIGSSIYGVSLRTHGIAWPPRFAMFWGVALAGSLLSIERTKAPVFRAMWLRRTALAIAVAGSMLAQVIALDVRSDYQFLPRFTLQAFTRAPRFVVSPLSGAEDAFLRCLGRDLPHDTSVTSTGSLFARFHRQDLLWPDRVATAWKPPELVVCDDSGRLPYEYGCLSLSRSLPGSNYEKLQLDRLFVRYTRGRKAVVESCAGRTAPGPGRAGQR
jgi:hypothetical protein